MACLTMDGVVVIETMSSAAEKVVTTDDFSPNHLAELLLSLQEAEAEVEARAQAQAVSKAQTGAESMLIMGCKCRTSISL